MNKELDPKVAKFAIAAAALALFSHQVYLIHGYEGVKTFVGVVTMLALLYGASQRTDNNSNGRREQPIPLKVKSGKYELTDFRGKSLQLKVSFGTYRFRWGGRALKLVSPSQGGRRRSANDMLNALAPFVKNPSLFEVVTEEDRLLLSWSYTPLSIDEGPEIIYFDSETYRLELDPEKMSLVLTQVGEIRSRW